MISNSSEFVSIGNNINATVPVDKCAMAHHEQAAPAATFTLVRTKQSDGGSNRYNDIVASKRKRHPSPVNQFRVKISDVKKENDPFLFYSIGANKMNYLLHRDGETDVNTPRQEDDNDKDTFELKGEEIIKLAEVRKTRISFELHTHAMLGFLMDDDDDENDDFLEEPELEEEAHLHDASSDGGNGDVRSSLVDLILGQ